MKRLEITLPILFWILMLYSCKEVSFKEPQPAGVKSLREIPQELIGKYQVVDKTTGEKNDSLIIESWGYHFKDRTDKDWLGKGTLSDSLVVKFYKNYYFINFRSDDQWTLRLVKRKPSGDLDFLSIDLDDESKRKSITKKLSKQFALKEIKKGDYTFYQIDPTSTQLLQLINAGYFTGNEIKRVK
jgi:hypothetical protein